MVGVSPLQVAMGPYKYGMLLLEATSSPTLAILVSLVHLVNWLCKNLIRENICCIMVITRYFCESKEFLINILKGVRCMVLSPIYCTNYGAPNQAQAKICFGCGQHLTLSLAFSNPTKYFIYLIDFGIA